MVNLKYVASESEQMYLISVAQMTEAGFEGPVPITTLAEALSVHPVSVNQMARKMEEAGLVVYQPYKGVELTLEGNRIATRILRYRRLWEVFLVQRLGMSLDEAKAEACNIEHDTSESLADRLDAFLGVPPVNPEGKPIPRSDGNILKPQLAALTTLSAGQHATVVHCEVSEAVRLFLNEQGLYPGVSLTLAAMGKDSLLVQAGEKFVSLACQLAENIRVELDIQKKEHIKNDLVQPGAEKERSEMKVITEHSRKIPLDELKVGQRGAVVRVGGKGPTRRRMVDMGLVPGAEVKVVRVAPLGDPIEFEVMGYSLSLRKSEAREITIDVRPEEGL